MGANGVRPFRVAVRDDVLDDLQERLGRVRWPDEIPGGGWEYGMELSYVRELVGYWRDGARRWSATSPTASPST